MPTTAEIVDAATDHHAWVCEAPVEERDGLFEQRFVVPVLWCVWFTRLTDDALATLESYCRAVGLARAYNALMDEEGHVLKGERGAQSHPAFKMLMGVMREIRLLAAELGLTPHRRAGRENEGAKPDAGWDPDLLA